MRETITKMSPLELMKAKIYHHSSWSVRFLFKSFYAGSTLLRSGRPPALTGWCRYTTILFLPDAWAVTCQFTIGQIELCPYSSGCCAHGKQVSSQKNTTSLAIPYSPFKNLSFESFFLSTEAIVIKTKPSKIFPGLHYQLQLPQTVKLPLSKLLYSPVWPLVQVECPYLTTSWRRHLCFEVVTFVRMHRILWGSSPVRKRSEHV